jgi:2-iminobutanoate/2-iminopropanoate deaminase
MERIFSEKAPAPVGAYVHGTASGNLIFISGQIGIDPKTSEMGDGVEEQTRLAMENIGAILESAGSDFSHVLKCTVYISNMDNFSKINNVYKSFFEDGKYAARVCVEIGALPSNAKVEIDVIAEKAE